MAWLSFIPNMTKKIDHLSGFPLQVWHANDISNDRQHANGKHFLQMTDWQLEKDNIGFNIWFQDGCVFQDGEIRLRIKSPGTRTSTRELQDEEEEISLLKKILTALEDES